MQSLKDKVSPRKLKEALAQLPRGSGSAASQIAYDETMNRIRGQEKGFCDLAIATLSWVSLAMRPLRLRELQCALSVEPGDTAMDEANFVDQETLSSACAGLVVVDHESRIVRLAHYTTQEYFESRKDVLFPDKQNLLAETCLTYLSFNVFSNWRDHRGFVVQPRASSDPFPLLNYAARHWHEHAHSSQDPNTQGLIIKCLKRTENLKAWLFCVDWLSEVPSAEPIYPQRFLGLPIAAKYGFTNVNWLSEVPSAEPFYPQSIHGLPIAARYGFTDAVKALLHLEGYCAEDRSRIKAEALSLAAIYRQSSALRILLDGNTIAPSAVSRALEYIRYQLYHTEPPGCWEVAEILLNHSADPNIRYNGIPLIHLACRRNDVRFASLLLSHGADVELRDRDGRTALHWVAEEGHSGNIVKVLLENKLDINAREYRGETALLTAAKYSERNSEGDHRSLITQLLGCGASVDQPDIRGRTALQFVAATGAVKIACQLLEAGADVNARNRNGYTAANCLGQWDWHDITEEERAECEEILRKA